MDNFNFVKYTLVDHITKIPVTQAPAKNGPDHPPFVTPTLEVTFNESPLLLGLMPKDIPDYVKFGISKITETEFYEIFKKEMLHRISVHLENNEGSEEKFIEHVTLIRNDVNSLTPDPELQNALKVIQSVGQLIHLIRSDVGEQQCS